MKVIAENYINAYFKTLSKSKKIIPGLILGQTCKEKAYFIHAVRNQDYAQVLNEVDSENQDIGQYCDPFIDHAQQVTRMLPGGTHVLGIFFISKDNIFDAQHVTPIQTVIKQIKTHLKPNEANQLNFLLHYNYTNDKIKCQSVDQLSKDIDLNIEFKKIVWFHIQSFFNFDELPCLYFSKEISLKEQSEIVLQSVSNVLNESIYTFNGAFSDSNTWIKSFVGKSFNYGDRKSHPIDVNIHLPCPLKENLEKVIFYEKSFVAKIICQGILGCNVYLNEDSTVQDAIIAVKNDIMRSLASRIDMHLDSLLEGEVNYQEMKTVHEPPRRILINLPESDVQLSDYLFPGETPSELSEALESLKYLLHIDILSSTIEKDFEDPSNVNEEPSLVTSFQQNSPTSKIEKSSTRSHFKILISASIVFLAIIVYQLFIKK